MDYLKSDVDRNRLFKAVEASYRTLETFRTLNKALYEEYAGSGYGARNKVKNTTVINLLHQLVEAYQMTLVANRPRVTVDTMQENLRFFARQYQLAMNNLIKEIRLEKTLKRWVLDAFFCIGVLKIHLAESNVVQLEDNIFANPGQPFVSNVSIDNFVFDAMATSWETIKFAGDLYRIPFSDLQDANIFTNQKQVALLTPDSRTAADGDKLDSISTGTDVTEGDLEPMIWLADIYIVRERKIYTFAVDNRDEFVLKGEPLAVLDWVGNDNGPYPILGFSEVSENTMPVSPADQVAELSRNINNILRKQFRQANRQKEITFYDAQDEALARKVKSGADGALIPKMPGSDPPSQTKYGGVDPGNQAFLGAMIQLFDRLGGNLTAMLGLGAQADTKGQEELIHGAVGKKAAQMQYQVVDGVVRVIRDLGKLLMLDEAKVIPQRMEIQDAPGITVDATWTPWDREGEYEDYNLDIDAYSMAYQTPTQKMGQINTLLKEVYAPLQQLFMQQGGSINMQELTDMYSDYMNDPNVRRIFQFVNALPPMGEQQGQGQGMPQTTERNYVRESVSNGGSPQALASQDQANWLSMAQQQGAA